MVVCTTERAVAKINGLHGTNQFKKVLPRGEKTFPFFFRTYLT
jgi:hypothetical protein